MNKLLTPSMARVLREMAEGEGEDGERDVDLIYERGAGWWVGNRRTSGRVALGLLRLCLVHEDQNAGPGSAVERYFISEDGRQILKSDTFMPRILRTEEGRRAVTLWSVGRLR